MIKELANFTENIPEEFKNIGPRPKEGVHILVKKKVENHTSEIDMNDFEYEIYSKKTKTDPSDFLERCKTLHQNAWCINTNKCFDLPTKAIHTCSPFCVAFKREHLVGGEKYKKNEGRKAQIYDRFDTYFEKAFDLFENEENKEPFIVFKQFFTHNHFSDIINSIEQSNTEKRINLLSQIEELKNSLKNSSDKPTKERLKDHIADIEQQLIKIKELEDSDYILFYLNMPLEAYKKAHKSYLDDKLFNTDAYNTSPNEENLIFGTSNFQNSYNGNMPFLIHQTASFDISGRISNIEARLLNEFQKLLPNKTLPRPLPVFIFKEELQNEMIRIFKESGFKMGYKEIIQKLIGEHQEDIGNYYLLFWQNTKDGIVFKDFDFVSRFEYKVDINILNYFEIKQKDSKENKYYPPIKNIFDFENLVFKQLLQNKYHRLNYFEDMNKDDYFQLDRTFVSYSKYRKAVYDFVYKSQRQAIQLEAFNEMVFNGILDDLKNTNEYGIKEKLNIWYSLYEMFNPNKNETKMASRLKEYQDFVGQLITSEIPPEKATDKQFAFAAGQVIMYILDKSKSSDTSFQLLEPYLQQAECAKFKENMANDFARYKHENFSRNFERAASFVLSYETNANLKHLLPEILSGVFANNQLYSSKNNPKTTENE